MRLIFPLLTLLIITSSCNKKNVGGGGKMVELYLLKTVQLVTNKCQVDGSNSIIELIPYVTNQEIIEYSKRNYEFKLSDQGIQKIKTLRDKTPFAVAVDKQVIYYGFFKPSISSSSCDHSISMDLSWSSKNKIMMRLGYPGQTQGITIDDKRNDPMLLATLANQNKLR